MRAGRRADVGCDAAPAPATLRGKRLADVVRVVAPVFPIGLSNTTQLESERGGRCPGGGARRARAREGMTMRYQGIERLEVRRLLAAVAWDGGGDATNWSDPLNWSSNV